MKRGKIKGGRKALKNLFFFFLKVGLAGSSAIVTATFQCLMSFFNLTENDIPKEIQVCVFKFSHICTCSHLTIKQLS